MSNHHLILNSHFTCWVVFPLICARVWTCITVIFPLICVRVWTCTVIFPLICARVCTTVIFPLICARIWTCRLLLEAREGMWLLICGAVD